MLFSYRRDWEWEVLARERCQIFKEFRSGLLEVHCEGRMRVIEGAGAGALPIFRGIYIWIVGRSLWGLNAGDWGCWRNAFTLLESRSNWVTLDGQTETTRGIYMWVKFWRKRGEECSPNWWDCWLRKWITGWEVGKGWTHREESSEGSTSSPVPDVTIELGREDGWEAKDFWMLLANAWYTNW